MDQKEFAWETLEYLYKRQFSNGVEIIPNSQKTPEKWSTLLFLENFGSKTKEKEFGLIEFVKPAENAENMPDADKIGYKSRITREGILRYEKYLEAKRNNKAIRMNSITIWVIIGLTLVNVLIELYRVFCL